MEVDDSASAIWMCVCVSNVFEFSMFMYEYVCCAMFFARFGINKVCRFVTAR